MAHLLQHLTDGDAQASISVDGMGAFDLVSRNAMLQGLKSIEDGGKVLPFVRTLGDVHDIPQGEGGEQGDPLMPLFQRELFRHAHISIHLGKTEIWNRSGDEPEACAIASSWCGLERGSHPPSLLPRSQVATLETSVLRVKSDSIQFCSIVSLRWRISKLCGCSCCSVRAKANFLLLSVHLDSTLQCNKTRAPKSILRSIATDNPPHHIEGRVDQ